MAVMTVAKQRLVTKKRAAYDLIIHLQSSDMKENEKVFEEVAGKKGWERILRPSGSEEINDQIKIQSYLNTLELLAVSIKMNIVDENVCKAIIGDTLIKRWQAAYPLIRMIRDSEGDLEFYEHFQDVAKRWKNNPKLEKRFWLSTILREITRI